MNTVLKNITPAIAVMVAGLAGAYMVYDNYFSQGTNAAMIAPAAGEEETASAEWVSGYDAAMAYVEETTQQVADAGEAIAEELQNIAPASGDEHMDAEHMEDAAHDAMDEHMDAEAAHDMMEEHIDDAAHMDDAAEEHMDEEAAHDAAEEHMDDAAAHVEEMHEDAH